MKRTFAISVASILSVAGLIFAGLTIPADAHPKGMCHFAGGASGKSGVYVYFPPGPAADAHHRHMGKRGAHRWDYPAKAVDAAHFESHGSTGKHKGRKCISTPPDGFPANRNNDHPNP
jgi:hypothetical protein